MAGNTTQLGIAQIPIRATLDGLERDLSKARSTAERGVKGIAGSVTKGVLGAAIVAAGVRAVSQLARGVVQGVKQAVAMASEEEKGITKLAAAVRASGGNWATAQGAIESYLAAELKRIALDDGEGRESLSRLVTATGSYEKAMALLPIAADLAAAKNMDLVTSSELIGKVVNGNTSALSRYGIVMDKGATATEVLTEIQRRFAGQAETAAATAAGGAKKLDVTIGNLRESFGAKLLPVLGRVRQALADALMRPEITAFLESLASKLGIVIETGFTWLLDNGAAVAGALAGIATALLAVGVRAAIIGALNPITLALSAIVVAVGALGAAWASDWHGMQATMRPIIGAMVDSIHFLIHGFLILQREINATFVMSWGEAEVGFVGAMAGVDKAMKQVKAGLEPVKKSVTDMVDSLAAGFGIHIKSAALLEALRGVKPAADAAADSLEGLGVAAEDSRDWVSGLQDALIATHPAARAAAAAVASVQAAIAGLNGALEANGAQMQAAQDRLQGMQDKLQGLNEQLTEAQARLDALSAPKLAGMGESAMQIGAIEAQLKRIDLAKSMKKPLAEVVAQYPLLTEGAEEYLATLPTTKAGLQKMLDQLQLIESLSYDERLKLLGEAANPPTAEMTFEQALAGITTTKAEIESLTGQITIQEAAIGRQEGAIRSLQAANDALNASLAAYNLQLQAAQAQQALITQGLQLAYTWFLTDRAAMLAMGGTSVEQAGVVDEKARALLLAISGFASGTTALSEETLAGLITSFQSSSADAVIEVNKSLGNIKTDITTTHHIVTVYEGAQTPPPAGIGGLAIGGPAKAGVAYLIGERGPELFMPRYSGHVIPAAETSRLLSQGDTFNNSAKELHLHLTTTAPMSLATEFRMLEALA